jgi:type I restriction enzyme R subunit
MEDALSHFEGVDKTIEGFEGLEVAQNAINTNEKKDNFAKDYKYLAKLWESLSPDRVLDQYNEDYRWLSQVYDSVRPASDNTGKLLWLSFGAYTTKLVHENVHVGDIHHLEEYVMDEEVIDTIFNNPDPKEAKRIEKELIKRFRKLGHLTSFKKLSERLEILRDKAEQGLINSIEFVKELCKIARETLQEEKKLEHEVEKSPKAALTELFLELKTDTTPAIIERIVNDIDEIVRNVIRGFTGWQNTSSGEREVQSSLRKILWVKYKIKDQILFDRAYAYIKEYYKK